MKLPLLGIAIIVVLQLSFTAYNALDRQFLSLAYVTALRTAPNPVAELSDALTIDAARPANLYVRARVAKNDPAIPVIRIRRAKRPSTPTIAFANTLIKVPAAKPDHAMLHFIAMHKLLNPPVNKYLQPMRPGGESENVSVQADRSTEKRSFVSKSASVLKKPYDWIKALGSKLK